MFCEDIWKNVALWSITVMMLPPLGLHIWLCVYQSVRIQGLGPGVG